MIFFLIVPVWFAIVCLGGVLFLFKQTRWLSLYIIAASTLSVICSFVASLLGLVGFAAVGKAVGAQDFAGLLAVGGYGIGLLAGGATGAIVGGAIVGVFHYRSVKKRVS